MAFCWSTLHVKDLDASVKFYKDAVGLKVIRRFEARPGVAIAFMGYAEDEVETQLELICDVNKQNFPQSDQVSLGFDVTSLRGTKDLLETLGIELYSEIIQPNPKTKFFYVKDPDGVSVQFIEFIDPDAVRDI